MLPVIANMETGFAHSLTSVDGMPIQKGLGIRGLYRVGVRLIGKAERRATRRDTPERRRGGETFDIMKPPHADPSHPRHANYNPETDDYPEEEASYEEAWRNSGGIDADGMIWLTPRMERNAKQLAKTLMNVFRRP